LPADPLAAALARLRPVTLDDLDARAALQRRVDRKYVLSVERAAALLAEVAADHEALEIEGRRLHGYESLYCDTPDLRCFHDQVADRRPRFKVRRRRYVDTGGCSLEVKVKMRDGETVKEHAHCDDDVPAFVARALAAHDAGPPPQPLRPSLTTRFRRATLVHAHEPERTTLDVHLALVAPGGAEAVLKEGHVLLETKTEDGEGEVDVLLYDAGIPEIGLSKYRVGIGLLVAREADRKYVRRRERWFRVHRRR